MNKKSEIAMMIESAGCSQLSLDAAKSLNRVIFEKTKETAAKRIKDLSLDANHHEDDVLRKFHRNAEESNYLD